MPNDRPLIEERYQQQGLFPCYEEQFSKNIHGKDINIRYVFYAGKESHNNPDRLFVLAGYNGQPDHRIFVFHQGLDLPLNNLPVRMTDFLYGYEVEGHRESRKASLRPVEERAYFSIIRGFGTDEVISNMEELTEILRHSSDEFGLEKQLEIDNASHLRYHMSLPLREKVANSKESERDSYAIKVWSRLNSPVPD